MEALSKAQFLHIARGAATMAYGKWSWMLSSCEWDQNFSQVLTDIQKAPYLTHGEVPPISKNKRKRILKRLSIL